MPKKQAFIDKSGVKFVENFQKNQKIKKFPSRTEIRYLTAFMQKSHANPVKRKEEVRVNVGERLNILEKAIPGNLIWCLTIIRTFYRQEDLHCVCDPRS
ncbi:hypothetical protein RP300_00422 [Oligella urethralis]|nr:hypothetical protein RP300_00422 [Oligella urethralis]